LAAVVDGAETECFGGKFRLALREGQKENTQKWRCERMKSWKLLLVIACATLFALSLTLVFAAASADTNQKITPKSLIYDWDVYYFNLNSPPQEYITGWYPSGHIWSMLPGIISVDDWGDGIVAGYYSSSKGYVWGVLHAPGMLQKSSTNPPAFFYWYATGILPQPGNVVGKVAFWTDY